MRIQSTQTESTLIDFNVDVMKVTRAQSIRNGSGVTFARL
jgi:hypothetical protein